MNVQGILSELVAGLALTEADAGDLFEEMLSGRLSEPQIAAVLSLIQVRGPTADELAGAARVMRRHVAPVKTPLGAIVIDTCGTGGAAKTFNVSTGAAIVAAAASPHDAGGEMRVVVAKHGNRSRTGRGSAEVLQTLGVNVDASADVQSDCLEAAGVCFCFAIHHHPATRHAVPVRKALGFPTIFNLLGPLTNPAGATRQLMGIYDPGHLELVAGVLSRLGAQRAMVVHSDVGLDELTPASPARVMHVEGNDIRAERFDPADLGIERCELDALTASSVEEAADFLRAVFSGEPGPRADAVALNAAAALLIAGAARDMEQGLEMARRAIAVGGARRALDELVRVSNAN